MLVEQFWGFFHTEPTCDAARASKDIYGAKDDVSWDRSVACDGDGCSFEHRDPEKIDRLEFNTQWGHYSEF